ncbi:alpha-1A adrenergic receptor-like [Patiria miniata]|uniref:G-protein coupled receptors family 1 profile domain-containing protein n=1 Tax=Patiria miniata TaxID=46514 RepID=A0A914AIM2_PATMI|nr:alpha-1A adrenergic receptor-like [Patiria miniata]
MATSSDLFPTEDLPSTMLSTGQTMLVDGRSFRFEDYTQRVIIATVTSLVTVCGIFGNCLTILAVVLSRKLQTKTNVFVTNLAVADLVTCLSAPFTVVALLSKDGWPLPELVCSLAAAIGYTCLSCSTITLAAIAINRYIIITKPMRTFQAVYTPRKIAVMLVLIWAYPILVCCIPLFGLGQWGYSDKYKTCTQDTTHETSDYFSLVGSVLIFPIPLVVLFVCYYKIYRHVTGHAKKMQQMEVELTTTESVSGQNVGGSTHELRKRSSSMASSINRRQVQITKNLFMVVCAFVACLAPFAIALVIPPSDPVIPWTGMFIIFNSMVNPLIYGFKHPHFKEVFRRMLRCQCHMISEPSGILRKMRSTVH